MGRCRPALYAGLAIAVLVVAGAVRDADAHGSATCNGKRWQPAAAGSYAALVRRAAAVRSSPGGVVVARFGSLEHNGRPNAFAVLGASGDPCRPDWYRVRFANSADGATGWVAASLVDPYRVRARIVVDLSARRLVLYVSGKQEISAPVAVGAAGTPTPTGRFFVTERWRILDPTGPLGAAALGISAHSSALHGWPRGAPIALHGTNDPASIGRAASHGCVRVDNTVIRRLLGYALLGTPVTIRP